MSTFVTIFLYCWLKTVNAPIVFVTTINVRLKNSRIRKFFQKIIVCIYSGVLFMGYDINYIYCGCTDLVTFSFLFFNYVFHGAGTHIHTVICLSPITLVLRA